MILHMKGPFIVGDHEIKDTVTPQNYNIFYRDICMILPDKFSIYIVCIHTPLLCLIH